MTHASVPTRATALALCAALAACGGDGPTDGPPKPATVASVNVTAPQPTLVAGSTTQLTGTPLSSAGQTVTGKTLQWQSSSDAVATVSSAGLVTAVAPGTVRITASVDGVSGFADLTVRAAIVSVQITPNPAEVAPGASRNLFLAALDAGNAPVLGFAPPVWTSSNEAVATVSSSGVVTGAAPGTAEIRATVEGVQGTATVRVAVPVPSGLRFSAVTAGSLHACGLDTDGRAWCWGINQSGQLGASSSDQCSRSGAPSVACSTYPIAVNTGLRFTAIDAGTDGGGEGTCAITTTGRPYCWGGGGYGQLGNGLKQDQPTPVAVNVPAGLTFTQVAAGSRFTCALATDGTVWCWGDNFYGTLGSGSPFADAQATPVQVNTAERFTSIAAGAVTACGLTAAGKAFCWGRVGTSNVDVRSPAAAPGNGTFTQIAVGGTGNIDVHVCGLQADGKALCWGENSAGQLGIPVTTTTTYPPSIAMGGLAFTSLYAGAGYTCGIQAGGTVQCAGRNQDGELGVGTMGRVDQPTPVQGPPFRTLSTGWFSCGVGTDGIAYCWGRNDFGQLGTTEGTTCQSQPGVPVIPCALQPVRVRGQD